MARDRLAAMRANQGVNYGSDPSPPSVNTTNGYGLVQPDKEAGFMESYELQEGKTLDMPAFMNEVSSLNDGIRSVNDNIDRIRDLHSRALSELDEQQHHSITNQLATLTTETSRLTNNIKNRINSLKSSTDGLPLGGDTNVRLTQVGALKKRLMDTITKYQSVEQESRQKYKQRMERQYKIVKPDATPEEIKQAVDSDDGGQVFSQALMTSNRYGDARAAFNEVKERHEDVKRIEQTLTELMQMFNDLATMVEEQHHVIENVETTAADVNRDTEQAGQHITKAKQSAAAARKKRIICFWLIVLILIIAGAIIAAVVVTQNNKNNNNKSTA
ncbi:uncharacterized protein MELLADRAFT_49002 [Melampsora larici-populina 98AG31]|uniref:t-SNARE coiled-coil homology domain-containing protein n=1 Tax=Melampsora larici-populina (strain 98AG31 / pathotype 3-4-7) TaxID=747676 RepID=F4RRS9_MELLP|nr:uncharacterized protein MELLADRAFT_49002 [Melampsora larici-populina 98AG31]EGG04735.1 hypothetical protein MELLADRAFT_49002 [Melampsora larici-populina 98AG31]